MSKEIDIIKKGHADDVFDDHKKEELLKCSTSPLYFIENYMQIQHPTKGRVPFEPFDYQREMITAFYEKKKSVVLASRQLGKCIYKSTIITYNNKKINIGSLINLNFKEKIIELLEKILLKLSI